MLQWYPASPFSCPSSPSSSPSPLSTSSSFISCTPPSNERLKPHPTPSPSLHIRHHTSTHPRPAHPPTHPCSFTRAMLAHTPHPLERTIPNHFLLACQLSSPPLTFPPRPAIPPIHLHFPPPSHLIFLPPPPSINTSTPLPKPRHLPAPPHFICPSCLLSPTAYYRPARRPVRPACTTMPAEHEAQY